MCSGGIFGTLDSECYWQFGVFLAFIAHTGPVIVINDTGAALHNTPYPYIGRILHTGGEALDRLRLFFNDWWHSANLRAMLAPVEAPDGKTVSPQVITDPAQLQYVNPYAPVMPVNTASLIDEFLDSHLHGRLAVILHPCELRSWVEMIKRREALHPGSGNGTKPGRLFLISFDCAGTYDPSTFAARVSQVGMPALTREGFQQSAPEGPGRYAWRAACQYCDHPYPVGADLGIFHLGLELDDPLLLVAGPSFAKTMDAENLTDGPISLDLWQKRTGIQEQIKTRRSEHFNRTAQNAAPCSLLAAFARCSMCTDCLDACPLYDGELASLIGVPGSTSTSAPLLVSLVGVSRWLASCSGCGMCQMACDQGVPLIEIVLHMNRHLCQELQYQPGDPAQKLPWI
jgi:formate dehydrogenase (coenzyme F420) beta subunit